MKKSDFSISNIKKDFASEGKMSKNTDGDNSNRGLASADQATRERVASAGGSAPHETRGLQGADQETRQRVASEDGKASHGGTGGSGSSSNSSSGSSKK